MRRFFGKVVKDIDALIVTIAIFVTRPGSFKMIGKIIYKAGRVWVKANYFYAELQNRNRNYKRINAFNNLFTYKNDLSLTKITSYTVRAVLCHG